jgi:hypothetical protein
MEGERGRCRKRNAGRWGRFRSFEILSVAEKLAMKNKKTLFTASQETARGGGNRNSELCPHK